jgi:hypothetical protein
LGGCIPTADITYLDMVLFWLPISQVVQREKTMKMKLEIVERKSNMGKKMIAPYINDWNVWDIPVKEWTPAVQDAVAHAYRLGAQHAITEMIKNTTSPQFYDAVWEKLV